LQCIDTLLVCLHRRLNAYSGIRSRFGFFQDFPTLSSEAIKEGAMNLSKFYSSDLDCDFGEELLQFQSFCQIFLEEKKDDCSMEQFMYKIIIENDVCATFPNTAVALKIFLSLMVSNCTGERSFSKLAMIKNLLRTTMEHDRLNHLALMSLNADILRSLDLTNVIHTFAGRKARKVVLSSTT
jgi:hypothetical protein